MRITSFTIFNQLTRSLHENLKILSKYSDRLSSGKKINKPSDDVSGMMKALDYKLTLNKIDKYRRNIEKTESQLGFTDTTLSSVVTSVTRARELAVQGSTGTQTADDRAAIAAEVTQLRDEVLRLSNSQFQSRYIFSGYKTDTQSFDATYTYQGDTNEIDVVIDANATMALNITGDTAFSYGGKSFMESLDDLRYALENNIVSGIQDGITEMDNALKQLANVRSDVGAKLNALDNLKFNLDDRDLSFQTLLSNTEDTDIAGTISEISKTGVALESLRASGSKILSQSLMDFIN